MRGAVCGATRHENEYDYDHAERVRARGTSTSTITSTRFEFECGDATRSGLMRFLRKKNRGGCNRVGAVTHFIFRGIACQLYQMVRLCGDSGLLRRDPRDSELDSIWDSIQIPRSNTGDPSMRNAAFIVIILTLAVTPLLAQQSDPPAAPQGAVSPPSVEQAAAPTQRADVPALSPQAMDALVAGIAFYPDQVIEQILEATQYPDAIARATDMNAEKNAVAAERAELPASVQSLTSSPEILRQLHDNPALTARLGLAARTQLAELWAAVDRVRQQFETSQPESTGAADAATATGAVPVAYPTGAFVAGYWTSQVVDEVGAWYVAAAPIVYGEGAVVVTGPNGTTAVASGSGAAGAVQVGDTTYFGAAGQGTVATSNGTVVTGQGQVTGSATKNESGGSYQTNASGSVASNTGKHAEGTRSASGSYQNNADGSVTFNRSADTQMSSNAGSTNIEHSGSGTVTGDGSGSYSGSTDIDSTHGDATVNTTAGDGQVSTTVNTDKGEKTYTLGDGQVGSGSTAASERSMASSSSRMARPHGSSSGSSRFAQAGNQQWQAASRSLADSWGSLSNRTRNVSNMNSIFSNTKKLAGQGSSPFAKPKMGSISGLQGGAQGMSSMQRTKSGPPTTRQMGNGGGPNRSPAGGGGRRGGGRR